MPLQLYDRDAILDACLPVFAEHGYGGASAALLAKAAGVSKALLFHHFGNKAGLYLALLDACAHRGRAALQVDELFRSGDFFEVRRRFSLVKCEFARRHPLTYRVISEAFLNTPTELATAIEERLGLLRIERRERWRQLFATVPLRRGVDRDLAFTLVMLAIDHFERAYIAEMTPETALDEAHVRRFIAVRDQCLEMIRFGIEPGPGADDV